MSATAEASGDDETGYEMNENETNGDRESDGGTSETRVVDSGTADRPATAVATFHATRDELLGTHRLPASAEMARSYCAVADRVVSVVGITRGRIRRVDCWLGEVGFVTHAGANDPSRPLLGSVCDRTRAAELTGSIIGSLVGGIPPMPAASAVELGPVGAIRPDEIPAVADWIVIVSASGTDDGSVPERMIAVGGHGGTAVTALDSLDEPIRIDPAPAAELHRRLTRLIGPPPRSVVELLADDRPRSRARHLLSD